MDQAGRINPLSDFAKMVEPKNGGFSATRGLIEIRESCTHLIKWDIFPHASHLRFLDDQNTLSV